ncbi:uncharacterized protein LOC120278195 [Dioscorea cayenensis subsp. rotundata]|uniref:Uncharacterized protein LOC120278195 n=1 Tax=Dioscorea cayennensis subsp. rotundata TaxID=55577 RepID=A0AB40CRB4_DIOCR|nr:uncharacterized protein LOC120278195 [Dioscorea cayenensis subsp. rotundata]
MHTSFIDLCEIFDTNVLKDFLQSRFGIASSFSCALLFSFFFPIIFRALLYFLPLIFSTVTCFMTVYMLISLEKQAAREILIINGGKSESGLHQIYDEANFSVYKEDIEVACFVLKRKAELVEAGTDGECEQITLTGKLQLRNKSNTFIEDDSSGEIDNLAEGVWNCYFGKFSRWY